MKQNIVIQLQTGNARKRSKALTVLAGFYGVVSIKVEKEKDLIEVIGDGVDAVALTTSLRKKLGFAQIVTVAEEKEKKDGNPSDGKPTVILDPSAWAHPTSLPYLHCYDAYDHAYDGYQRNVCSIM